MTAHKSFRDYINLIESAQQPVAEGSENNNPIANKIFFARSNKTHKGWKLVKENIDDHGQSS